MKLAGMEENKMTFDVAVIGGGPAGMMAAGRAAELGARVVLIEKNEKLGRKLLLTGNGRCNFTHGFVRDNYGDFAGKFGKQGKFLLSGLSVFGPEETVGFFNKLGVEAKAEKDGRVFPKSDRAADVLDALLRFLRKNKVTILTGREIRKFRKKGNEIISILAAGGREIIAKEYVICAGGKSYPSTGSAGDGFKWARELGHSVSSSKPALVPVKIAEKWARQAQGVALENIGLSAWQGGKKQDETIGETLFAHFGLSGPAALDMSKKIGEILEKGEVKLKIDLRPDTDLASLDKEIQGKFNESPNKAFKNFLLSILPKKLAPIFIGLSGIGERRQVNGIAKEERKKLAGLIKGLEMTVAGLMGFDRAMVTSGGICLKEIDPKTMKSKLIGNLYFAGETLDLDGPCGGYNLQACWTTGYLAGQSAANEIKIL